MASVVWVSSSPSCPRSGLAGEVVEVVRRVLSPISVSPAGRGGEGSRRWLGASWFWCWCCRWSSSPASLLWPAEVARGVVFAGVLAARMVDLRSFFGLDLSPVQGCWIDGGRSGAGGPFLRLFLPDQEEGASRPMVVHRFMSRRLTAGDSRCLKAWRCSFQDWGRVAFFFSAGDDAGRERRRALRWFSFSAVALVLRIRQYVCGPVYGCVLVCSSL